jgi:ATP-binding cassette, subfamily B, bacterial MsbA
MDKMVLRPPRASLRQGDFALLGRLLKDYLGPQKWALAAAALCMLGSAVTPPAIAWLVQPAVQYFFIQPQGDMLMLIPVALVGIVLLRAVCNFGEAALMGTIGQRITAGTLADMAKSIVAFDLKGLNAVHSGEFISSFLYDAALLRDAVAKGIAACGKEILSLAFFAALMLYQSWRLTLISIVVLPVIAIVTRNLGRTVRKATGQGMTESGALATAIAEMLDGRRIVKAYGLEQRTLQNVQARIDARLRSLLKVLRSSAVSAPAADFFGGLAFAVVLLVSGYLSTQGQLTADRFASFVAAMLLAQSPVRNLSNLWTVTTSGLPAAKRVYEIIDTKPTIADAPDAEPLRVSAPPFGGNVRFENVSFGYVPGKSALNGVSFDVAPGKKIAFVGPSGAGKSTVFNLLLRFYEPDGGRIAIDGQDIRDVTMDSLRTAIALVTQEPFLFDETIGANIGYGHLDASQDEIIAAAQSAAAHAFIAQLPEGYDTRVGEGGLRLSGGQRQRIAIARAMLRQAPILLLDEATSALDTENERQVQEALKRLMKGRTTIVIAHRLTTVLDADQIHVLDGGRVVESGSHGELMARGGLYARLYQHEIQEDETAPAARLR